MSSRTALESKTAFQNELIGPTVAHAASQSEFYRARFGSLTLGIKKISDLPMLPTTTKQLMRQQELTKLLTSSEVPYVKQHTSGTTDRPFYVLRGKAEVDFIRIYFSGQFDPLAREQIRILSLQPQYHGDGIPIPVSAQFENVNVMDAGSADRLVDRLFQDVLSPGSAPVILTGIFSHVRALTLTLISKQYDFRRSPVLGIYVTGQYVSKRWHDLLRTTWERSVTPRFSLTEGFGGALYCEICGCYHFDQFVVAEVLSPHTLAPLAKGIGLLHLTSLYPFVQLMPFIRYRTNDIVEIMETQCTETRGASMRFLGRWDHAAVLTSRNGVRVVVPPSIVHDILELAPIVNTLEAHGVLSQSGSGNPCFRLRVLPACAHRLAIDIDLRVAPWIYPAACRELSSSLLSVLGREIPMLQTQLDENLIEIEINYMAHGETEPLEPGSVPELAGNEKY